MKKQLLLAFSLLSLNLWGQSRLSDKIPYPFFAEHSRGENTLINVDSGIVAFKLRLEMIRRAQRSIELEYFIYNTDMAGKILTRELIQASQRGVKVRLLIDKSAPIFQFDEYYAKELKERGLEVRYYNPAPLYQVSTVQFRNHRKLMVIDDQEALTGGRNIGDDYFDLSHHFNFNDRDLYVKGSMARVMRESFDKYFEHPITERPTFPSSGKKYLQKTQAAESFLEESAEEMLVRARIEEQDLSRLQEHVCPETTFSTDAPGARFTARLKRSFSDNHRFLRKTLFDKIVSVDKKFLISSPYVINNKESRELFKLLREKNVDIDVYTNSLGSTDAAYVAANLYLGIKGWIRKGVNVYLHDGKWLNEDPNTPEEIRKARWGTHDKSMIFESATGSEIMVGTYNVDNRSNFYNSEMAVFCRGNEELTQEIRSNIMGRAHKGLKVHSDGKATDREGKSVSMHGADKSDVLKMRLITLPSWLLRFLL